MAPHLMNYALGNPNPPFAIGYWYLRKHTQILLEVVLFHQNAPCNNWSPREALQIDSPCPRSHCCARVVTNDADIVSVYTNDLVSG